MKWIIYDKTGSIPKCVVHKLEYSGEFMGACNVTCTIESPQPVNFEIGDFLDYRGERFYINYDPSVLKRARCLSVGNSFEYSGVVLNSAMDELVRCDFLDYVLADNHIHFTALPNFTFYAASVKDLADRLQANLDRVYKGEQKWSVTIHPDFVGEKNVNVQINTMKVWDALALVNSTFKGNFIIRNRHITIGTEGITAGKMFKYGKDNGLVQIERTAESDQGIITRLRAYGSNKNMPSRYYNKLSGADGVKLVPDNMAVSFLMLPDFPEKSLDPYIDSKNVETLGVREGTIIFDGSGDTEEIFPSIKGMTAAQLQAAGIPVGLDEGDNGNLDEVFDAEQLADDGKKPEKGTIPSTFKITLKDIGFDINKYKSAESATIALTDGRCGGREFTIVKCVKQGNKYILTCNREEDNTLDLAFPYKDYNIKKGDKFVLLGIEMPDVYIKAASQKLLEKAKEYLAKNDYVRYVYSPKVDNIFMARQHDNAAANKEVSLHDTLKEGDMLMFEDTDLGISGNIIIDTLSIQEGESIIPHYEITLRNEKSVGTIDKMQQQIDSIMSGGGGLNTDQVASIIKAIADKRFIRKDIPDSTNNLLKLLGGVEVGEAIDSFLNGKGIILDKNGRIQADSIEVRNSMKVLELIINRLQGMENDFVFSPTRKVLKVVPIDLTTYKLFLEPKHDGDLIPFRDGNIYYSIINDLLTGGHNYYTSYGRVLSTNQNEYSITISLYPDSEVPGGKNYPPAEGYNISRRGHVNLMANKEDSQSWYLSSSEGRLLFLQNVVKPVLEDYNYALSIGRFPRIQAIEDIGLPEDAVGVMAETIVAQHVYYYDYNGDIVPNIVDRGTWSLATAQSAKPYRNVKVETMRPSGTKYTLLEQHGVWRHGCFWGCLVDKTTEEPKWNAQSWALLKGDGSYNMTIDSSAFNTFRKGHVDTILTARVTHGMEDISETLETLVGAEIVWFRDTNNPPSDNMWKPTYESGKKLRIHITNADMPSEFGFSVRSVAFICRVYAPDGAMLAEQEFGFV